MNKELKQVVILFAGDSGDGMQLTGSEFTNTTAHYGNDLSTFPDFPAEIRAPGGTEAGVSGFQVHFGSVEVTSPGDQCDVLVAMNAAAFMKNKAKLKPHGILIANTAGFDARNLRLAKLDTNPLIDAKAHYEVHEVDIQQQVSEALKESPLSVKDKDKTKNMFALGFVYWLFNRPLDYTLEFLQKKFAKQPEILAANQTMLRTGYNYGEVTDTFTERYVVAPAAMPKGKYRNITGNHALAIGLVTAAHKAGVELFYGGYPITPASDILHFLSRYKNFGVKTFQAEDEIAAIGSAIGASYAGALGVTTSSGPGISLKIEAMGLAVMLEIPLVIVNVQRGGPSTGLPTKTEQADLLQAIYGRNGEAPIPVLAAKSPQDCFYMAFEAARIAVEHMTPVILLSDGYIANGSEPWRFPTLDDLPQIQRNLVPEAVEDFEPYRRDARFVRNWAVPGTPGLEHRVGGLEKKDITGDVSYEPLNHELMVKQRQAKVDTIAQHIPHCSFECGGKEDDVLVIGWGGSYGAIQAASRQYADECKSFAHIQLQYLYPLPENLEEMIRGFTHVIVPEVNQGQLVKILREKFLIDAKSICKTQGVPFTSKDICEGIKKITQN
ncbi:MAG: 2-oxoacid:acceptor oxidoreductase subunit alpha [Weeksellaceae bacterium]|nr:2-oxoacid:acceptor oxidoreductase subunit alpha [Weeksellaceae bacterium]